MDDVLDILADCGEELHLAGVPVVGLFNVAGEVVLDGILTTATTAHVASEVGAQVGQTLVRHCTSYRVRKVLPQPPDGALQLLVLAKV